MSDMPLPPLVFGPVVSILYLVVAGAILTTVKDRRVMAWIILVNALGAGIYALVGLGDLVLLNAVATLLLVPLVEEFVRHRVLTGRPHLATVLKLGLLWGTAELAINGLPALFIWEAFRPPAPMIAFAAVAIIVSNLAFHICLSLLMASGMARGSRRYRVVGVNTGIHSLFNFYALFSAALFVINPMAGLGALLLRLAIVALVLAFLVFRHASDQAADVPASARP